MKRFAILLIFGLCACGRQADQKTQPPAKPVAVATAVAAQPMTTMSAKISIPKDKAQLNRLLAMGYTVHEDHMHPPGVKECAFDKRGGSVIQ